MDLSKLSEGMVVKNYKELCKLLNEDERKGGDSKIAHLKEIGRFIDYEKNGIKFIIKEIYETPKPESLIGKTIYSDYIQMLILDLLVSQYKKEKQSVFLSTCKILRALNMINDNYGYGKENIQALACYLEMNEHYIYEFYSIAHNNLKGLLESALNSLKNKALIIWSTVVTVCVGLSEEELELYELPSYMKEIHRPAFNDEKELIVTVEKEILDSMTYETKSGIVKNFTSKKEIFLHRRWKEFINAVNKRLSEVSNIKYYYTAYEINFNNYIEGEKLKLEGKLKDFQTKSFDKEKVKNILNATLVDNYKINNKNRQINAIKQIEEFKENEMLESLFISTYDKPTDYKYNKLKNRTDEQYLNNNDKLVDTLINNSTNNIVYLIDNKYKKYMLKVENQ